MMSRALLVLFLALCACEYRENLGEHRSESELSVGKDGGPKATCDTADACGGCCAPPTAGECTPSLDVDGTFRATRPVVPGVCQPFSGQCLYLTEEEECPDDCTAGACHVGPSCDDWNPCDGWLSCKPYSATELRCQGGDLLWEDEPCDESVKGKRCGTMQACIKPSFRPTKVCAHLCENDDDCLAYGLLNQDVCVKDAAWGSRALVGAGSARLTSATARAECCYRRRRSAWTRPRSEAW